MSSNIMSEDLRSIKTKKALYAAMFSLLKTSSFKKITVKEICEEALVSRATFYSHFIDKYELLKYWMAELWPKDFISNTAYEQIEMKVNQNIDDSMLILKNSVHEADDETLGIFSEVILSSANFTAQANKSEKEYPKNIVLSSFYAGGLISYLQWQVKNKFPSDVPLINQYLYEIIHELQDWQSKYQ